VGAKQPQGLILVLLDSNAEYGDRDDAAMDLANFDGDEVESALAQVACDAASDPELADTCGESLAEFWARRGLVNGEILRALPPASRDIAIATLVVLAPELTAQI
jgi:hypothetical protein